jgi:O-acetyl-ADP-ribose deacetylase (regulator of RNase III)
VDGAVDASTSQQAGVCGVDDGVRLHVLCDVAQVEGDAKVTSAGRLPAKHIIHAVGPVWGGGQQGESELLASCHRRAIELAAEHGCRRVAFPAISTGIFGYPLGEAAAVAITATAEAMERHLDVEEARFWLFGEPAYEAFERALRSDG